MQGIATWRDDAMFIPKGKEGKALRKHGVSLYDIVGPEGVPPARVELSRSPDGAPAAC